MPLGVEADIEVVFISAVIGKVRRPKNIQQSHDEK
jgi:hypothetical protein